MHTQQESSMWTANFILRMTCRVVLILLLIVHLSTCVHKSTNSTCTQNPQSCLSPHIVARIAELAQCCLYVEEEALPYKCAYFHPRTIPREYNCEKCSDPNFGCLNDHGRLEKWQKVCDFFCPPLSNNSVVNATSSDEKVSDRLSNNSVVNATFSDQHVSDRLSNKSVVNATSSGQQVSDRLSNKSVVNATSSDQQVGEPHDNGSKTSKIVIIVFCLLVLAMPCIIVVVIIFESFRRYCSHTRSTNNSPIVRLDFTVLQYLYTTLVVS